MSAGGNPPGRATAGWPWILLFLVLFQGWVRYAAAPTTGLVLDDWNNWSQARSFASFGEASQQTLSHPERPLTFWVITMGYRVMGDRAAAHAGLSMAAYSLVLALAFLLALSVTGRLYPAFLFGMVLILMPNLHEHVHWPTVALSAGACALPLYLGSAWAWTRYARGGRGGWLALSAVLYGLGLFGYEIGALLPLSYPVLTLDRKQWKGWAALWPFAIAMGLYAAWRMTNAFGLGYSWYGSPPHMRPSLALANVWWSSRDIVRWWAGDLMGTTVLGGLNGLGLLGPWARRGLVVANVAVWAFALHVLRRMSRCAAEPDPSPAPRPVAAFALAWIACAYAPSMISYVAGRLNYLPAVGVALWLAWELSRRPLSSWIAGFGIVALLCMLSIQGTARNWKESARFNRNLFAAIEREHDQWSRADILLVDTRSLAERLAPDLTGSAAHNMSVVSQYRGVGLLRGFAPSAMVRLVAGEGEAVPLALLDVEYGARLEGEQLIWHERYDPARARRTPRSKVVVIEALQGAAPR
jgi:hypothetical protein